MLRRAKDLFGYTIKASDDDNMGTVHDFYFDAEDWEVRYLVIDIGSWFFGRRVLIAPDAVQKPDWEAKVWPVNLTKAQVKDSPDVDFAKPISREYEADLHQHYNWPTYWGGIGQPYIAGSGIASGMMPVAERSTTPLPDEVVESLQQADESHVQSIREASNSSLKATDGAIGHVTDFFIDDENWTIRYLLIDTGTWLPDKQVLIAPAWVDIADWDHASIHVTVSRDQVKQSPEYDSTVPLGRSYEGELHEHYGYPEYWK